MRRHGHPARGVQLWPARHALRRWVLLRRRAHRRMGRVLPSAASAAALPALPAARLARVGRAHDEPARQGGMVEPRGHGVRRPLPRRSCASAGCWLWAARQTQGGWLSPQLGTPGARGQPTASAARASRPPHRRTPHRRNPLRRTPHRRLLSLPAHAQAASTTTATPPRACSAASPPLPGSRHRWSRSTSPPAA